MKSLYQDYRKFEKIAKKFNRESSTLDISSEDFLAPTTLIPLTCFAITMKQNQLYNYKYYDLDNI